MDNLAIPGFQRQLREYGLLDANACLNCGSCTIVCDLSTDLTPFPRRPLQYALLGLRDRLRSSLEPWLCHDCEECSALCPRQAHPAESLATLRRYLASEYDFTGLTRRIYRSGAWEIGSLIVAAFLVLAIAYGYHLYASGLSTSELLSMPMGLEHMFPKIVWFTRVVYLLPVLFLALGARRMHKLTMREDRISLRIYVAELRTMVVHLILQRHMRTCPQEKVESRWLSHWLLALAFGVMSIILFFALSWFQTDAILPIYHPQRWIGYAVAAVMLIVPATMLFGRSRRKKRIYEFSEPEDITLPLLLLLTAASGLAIHILRYIEFPLSAHFAYAIHMAISVPLLVVELPFGKLSHVVYRPLAIFFRAVKQRALEQAAVDDARAETEAVA